MKIVMPNKQQYPSPLRYPGGKTKLANFLKLVMLHNGLVGAEYIEPYSGGAGVAISLLFEEYASHVHINDINRSVHAFWQAVLEQPDELCRRIRGGRVTVQQWHKQRAVQADPDADDLDLAYSTFFLNRTSRSGILNGGIIGGYEQMGTWKIDARWRPDDLVHRIERIARFRSRITLTRLDAAQYLRERLPELVRPFVYLDPPYYLQGSTLYENFYDHDDHAEIAELVKGLRVPWIVSYDCAPEIQELYGDYAAVSYDLVYSAGARQAGREVMFFSDRLPNVPEVASPSSVSATRVGTARAEALAL
jgi:DNA adenine methylase